MKDIRPLYVAGVISMNRKCCWYLLSIPNSKIKKSESFECLYDATCGKFCILYHVAGYSQKTHEKYCIKLL